MLYRSNIIVGVEVGAAAAAAAAAAAVVVVVVVVVVVEVIVDDFTAKLSYFLELININWC